MKYKAILSVVFLMSVNICKAETLTFNNELPVYYFANHETTLDKLKTKLHQNKIVGVTGISGIGKSELIRKYVENNSHNYKIIAFIDANVDMLSQFVDLAQKINKEILKDKTSKIDTTTEKVISSLKKFLEKQDDWLLIFDNLHINQNDKIEGFINWSHNGNIIVASQDSSNLLSRVKMSWLEDHHTITIIDKIMQKENVEIKTNLALLLKDYPTYIISRAAIFLENNPNMGINDYIKIMEKTDDKIKTHLELIEKNIAKTTKDLLYKLVLLNNQKIPLRVLESLFEDKEQLSDAIIELTRFGLIEIIAETRHDNPVLRIHDIIKNKILDCDVKLHKKNVEDLLDSFNNIIPFNIIKRAEFIKNNPLITSTIEVLLNNSEKFNANKSKILELRANILWYYWICIRSSYHSRDYVKWFKDNQSDIDILKCNNREKAAYVAYLVYIGSYYYVVCQDLQQRQRYFLLAEEYLEKIEGYEELKSYLYLTRSLLNMRSGDIVNAKKNLLIAKKYRPKQLKMFLGKDGIEHIEALIMLTEGNYNYPLELISEKLKKSSQIELLLFPECITQAKILNYMEEYEKAYDIAYNKLYSKLVDNSNISQPSYFWVRTLTLLAWSEIYLNKKEEALEHSKKAIDLFLEDHNLSEEDLDNSKNLDIALTLSVRAIILSEDSKNMESMQLFRTAKDIYFNVYGSKNIGNIDQIGHMFLEAVKASRKIKDKNIRKKYYQEYYELLLKYFGAKNFRTIKAKEYNL